MNYTIDNHPTEDILSACALDERCELVEQHIEICHTCKEFVDDIRTVRDEIAHIEDEEIPVALNERILAIAKQNNKTRSIPPFILEWYKRPFVYGIITAIAAILSYVIFTFFL